MSTQQTITLHLTPPTGFVFTGEFRLPRYQEWIWGIGGKAVQCEAHPSDPHFILRPAPLRRFMVEQMEHEARKLRPGEIGIAQDAFGWVLSNESPIVYRNSGRVPSAYEYYPCRITELRPSDE